MICGNSRFQWHVIRGESMVSRAGAPHGSSIALHCTRPHPLLKEEPASWTPLWVVWSTKYMMTISVDSIAAQMVCLYSDVVQRTVDDHVHLIGDEASTGANRHAWRTETLNTSPQPEIARLTTFTRSNVASFSYSHCSPVLIVPFKVLLYLFGTR